MARDVLSVAWSYMRKRDFSTAIKLLEGRLDVYEDNFEYYFLLGTACLYIGDIGSAILQFQQARRIKITDPRLLLAQAAIYLRRGDTDRALMYYLEVREYDPNNQIAKDAIEFIRTRGDFDTICRWADTGRLEQFYPPLGVNPNKALSIVLPVIACLLGCVLAFVLIPRKTDSSFLRKDLSELSLTKVELKSPVQADLSGEKFNYILSSKEIKKSYNVILEYFQARRDNAAIIEINRLLNSNASNSIKQKLRVLQTYLEAPTFDSIKDVPSFSEVEKDPNLYIDCYVDWEGRVSDVQIAEDGSYSCRFLVGYGEGKRIEGIINLWFLLDPNIETDKSVKILGKITKQESKIYLSGKAVYQSVKNTLIQ